MAHRRFTLSPIRSADACWRRATPRGVLGVTYHYGAIGAVGYLLIGALAGHDVDLLFIGALAALYGAALGRTFRQARAVPPIPATTTTRPPMTDRETPHGA